MRFSDLTCTQYRNPGAVTHLKASQFFWNSRADRDGAKVPAGDHSHGE